MKVPPKGKARQTHVAKIFGVSQKGARKWLEAEGYPSTAMGKRIARWGGVTFDWLMTGDGPRTYGELYSSPAIAQVATRMAGFSPEQQALALRLIDQLAPDINTQSEGKPHK